MTVAENLETLFFSLLLSLEAYNEANLLQAHLQGVAFDQHNNDTSTLIWGNVKYSSSKMYKLASFPYNGSSPDLPLVVEIKVHKEIQVLCLVGNGG